MKKIKIIQFTEPDFTSIITKNRKYHLCLWNGKVFYFQNKKDLIFSLNQANFFLNEKMNEINVMLNNIYIQYRQSWYYCNAAQTRNINSNLSSIDNTFELMINRCHYINGNFYVGSWFRQILSSINQILEILISVNKNSLNYVQAVWCESIMSQVDRISNQLLNYEAYCKINIE